MATTVYMRQISGVMTEVRTVETSAGAGDASKIPNLNAAGVLGLTIVNGVQASAGSGDAGKVAALDSAGRLDITMMPVGVSTEAVSVVAAETIAAGDYGNLHNASGTLKVRKADNSNNRPANCFALAGIASAATGTVYLEGTNTGLSARTLGAIQYLGVAGAAVEAAGLPTAAGSIVQILGTATSATAANFEPEPPITLA